MPTLFLNIGIYTLLSNIVLSTHLVLHYYSTVREWRCRLRNYEPNIELLVLIGGELQSMSLHDILEITKELPDGGYLKDQLLLFSLGYLIDPFSNDGQVLFECFLQ